MREPPADSQVRYSSLIALLRTRWGSRCARPTANRPPANRPPVVRRWLRLEILDARCVLAGDSVPLAVNDPETSGAIVANEDITLQISQSILSNDSDADGDALSVHNHGLLDSERGATILLNPDGTFTYNPATAVGLQELSEGAAISDSFVYRVTDGAQASAEATVTILVQGINDAPLAQPLVFHATEDGEVLVGFFSSDDLDDDDDASSLRNLILSDSLPTEGLLVNNEDGSFSFTPDDGLSFQDLAQDEQRLVTFVYRAADRHAAESNEATVTIVVTGANDAPVCADMLVQAIEDNGGVTLRFAGDDVDSDDEPGTLLYTLLSSPSAGVMFDNGNGTFTFDPGDGFQDLAEGQIRQLAVTYNAIDGQGAISQVGTITVHVTGTNDAPLAHDAAVRTFENIPLSVNLIDTSEDVDGTIDPYSVEVSEAAHGRVSVGTSGFVYTPDAGFIGNDRVEYTVKDNKGARSNKASIDIKVALDATRYRNHKNHLDVNADGVVTPFDALLVISFLNKNGSRAPFGPSPPYYDTAPADNLITPHDALAVMQFLNNRGGLGEKPARSADDPEGESRTKLATGNTGLSSSSSENSVSDLEPVQQPAVKSARRSVHDNGLHAFLLLRSRRDELEQVLESLARTLRGSERDMQVVDQALVDQALVDQALLSLAFAQPAARQI